ncbi:uncharacterized protein BDW43DRAFT_286064 [Aspergillus alliaceus]|uniref:uncharacterized protein n=1 Tax=Petromyces alliaceus TaxID=209559 RepID=UPI0012A66F96|nr:uncharacterized protein BDW43DRAFT_286064 [Aspergillus alliaceus]KAB8230299.1 hypothetical protein BDW43DRAFT_286064 [Aspergillus alliaceus]
MSLCYLAHEFGRAYDRKPMARRNPSARMGCQTRRRWLERRSHRGTVFPAHTVLVQSPLTRWLYDIVHGKSRRGRGGQVFPCPHGTTVLPSRKRRTYDSHDYLA